MKRALNMNRNQYDVVAHVVLSCNLCRNKYENPKILPCFHTFCENCLTTCTPAQSLTLQCYTCGSHSILPRYGVIDLNTNHFMERLLSTSLNMSSYPEENHLKTEEHATTQSELHASTIVEKNHIKATSAVEIADKEAEIFDRVFKATACDQLVRCHYHAENLVTWFCQSCDTLACDDCIQLKHGDHQASIVSMKIIADNIKKNLLLQTSKINSRRHVLESWLNKIEATSQDLCIGRESAIQKVKEAYKILEDLVSLKKEKALQEIEAEFAKKHNVIDCQKEELANVIKVMSVGSQLVENSIRLDETEDVLISNNSDKSDLFKRDIKLKPDESQLENNENQIKMYFLHKHMTQRLQNIYEYGSPQTDPSTTAIPTKMLRDNAVQLNHNKISCDFPAGQFLTEKFGAPNDNCFFKWSICPDFQRQQDLLQASEIGNLTTNHAIAAKSIISGECLLEGAKVDVENHLILTTKDYKHDMETSGLVDVDIKLVYRNDVCEKNEILNDVPENLIRNNLLNNFNDNTKNKVNQNFRSQTTFKGTPPIEKKVNASSKIYETKTYSNTHADYSVTPTNEGAYEIILIPRRPGEYMFSAKFYEEHVHNSPCVINAFIERVSLKNSSHQQTSSSAAIKMKTVRQKAFKRPPSSGPIKQSAETDMLFCFGTRGKNKGEFSNPQDVTIDANGKFYVTDSNNHCIQTFSVNEAKNFTAKCLNRFGERDHYSRKICRPAGITCLSSQILAISDYDNKAVNFFTLDGKFRSQIGPGKLQGPRGICVNHNGHLVVVDNKQCKVFVFQPNGKLVTKFGSRGTEPEQFAGPHYAAVNHNNDIFITDFYNHCVKVFTFSGKYLRCFGTHGEGCGQFNAPTGIAIDTLGHVIVADWGNSRLQVFDDQGSFLSYINTNEDPLYGPQGITVTSAGYVAVVDTGNQRVKLYKILQ